MHRLLPLIVLCWCLVLQPPCAAWAQSVDSAWPTGSGEGLLELRADYLPSFGITVLDGGLPVRGRHHAALAIGDGRLWLYAPFGNFEAFSGGHLAASSAIELQHGDQRVALDHWSLRPAEQGGQFTLQLHDTDGNHLANVTHLHVVLDRPAERLYVRHAGITATARLAELLGQPALAGLSLGVLKLNLDFSTPVWAELVNAPGSVLPGCEDRPKWPQAGYPLDVALTDMRLIQYQGTEPETGRIKIAPSAALQNVGEADVPWIKPFGEIALYPHEPRDQHPFLVWNLYRIHEGRLEQLAASGLKHAFFTVNSRCDLNCSVDWQGDYILWPGCQDVYSESTNDLNHRQGPRAELVPHLALWDSCGSFFDPDCTGEFEQFAEDWQHRLMVDPAELALQGARYFLDAWYLIQFDIDIWNSMAFREIEPQVVDAGGWTFAPGAFQQGSLLGEWVPENTLKPSAGHQLIVLESDTPDAPYPGNMPLGHVRALARVEALGEGRYRYRYAVMNFDLSRGLHEFRIPLPANAPLDEVWMGGPPDVLTAPWAHERDASGLVFRAPPGHSLPWFNLYNFEFVTQLAPGIGAVELISIVEEHQRTLATQLPVPSPSIHCDRFEQAAAEAD
ncbi:MAG: hypothetical protein ACXIUM_14465 [Wenzhouxiangella sp.]